MDESIKIVKPAYRRADPCISHESFSFKIPIRARCVSRKLHSLYLELKSKSCY